MAILGKNKTILIIILINKKQSISDIAISIFLCLSRLDYRVDVTIILISFLIFAVDKNILYSWVYFYYFFYVPKNKSYLVIFNNTRYDTD